MDVNSFLGAGHDVSTKVECDVPVVAERPMYFDYHGKWAGGHDSMGVASPSSTWYFAEGTTRNNTFDGSYEQWLCMQNPNHDPARVHVTFLRDRDGPLQRDYVLAPTSRMTVDVNRTVGAGYDVGSVLTSDRPIVAERPQYSVFRNRWKGGDVVTGTAGPLTEWHFAEGCTRDGFQTWLSLSNPQERDVTADIEYFLGDGRNIAKSITVPARSRRTVDVNVDVGNGQDVSCRVTATEPIVAERPMYFDYHGAWDGGHDSMGVSAPGTEWYFAEGCTR